MAAVGWIVVFGRVDCCVVLCGPPSRYDRHHIQPVSPPVALRLLEVWLRQPLVDLEGIQGRKGAVADGGR